jgi:hypothetical protein
MVALEWSKSFCARELARGRGGRERTPEEGVKLANQGVHPPSSTCRRRIIAHSDYANMTATPGTLKIDIVAVVSAAPARIQ